MEGSDPKKKDSFSADEKDKKLSGKSSQPLGGKIPTISAFKRGRGKRALHIDRYREKCLVKLASLESRMEAIADHRDPQYKKLRCQKIAYQKRLRDRNRSQKVLDEIALTEGVIELVSSEALKMLPAAL